MEEEEEHKWILEQQTMEMERRMEGFTTAAQEIIKASNKNHRQGNNQ